jgi:hypothetical protein
MANTKITSDNLDTNIAIAGTLGVTGNITGTLATASQPNITSVGTLSTLTVDDITINGSTISDSGILTITAGDDFIVDAEGDISLDANGGDIRFKDNGTVIGEFTQESNNFVIKSAISDEDLIFKGNDGGSTITALTLDMSDAGTALFNNKVGIGTTSPDYKLHLHDSSQNSYVYMSGGGSLGESYGGFVRGYGVSGSGGNLDLGVNDGGNLRTSINIQPQGNAVIFSTAGTERMRIDSAGTIFQGTTSPTLHSAVRGIVFENGSIINDVTRGAGKSMTLAQNAAVDSGNTWAYLATDEASYYQQFGGNHYFGTAPSGSAGADVTFDTKMFIANAGNVGIGTTSPSKLLHIQNAGDSQILIYETGTSPYTATLKLASQSTTAYGANVQYTSGAEQLTIENFGRALSASSTSGGIRFRTKVGNSSMTEVLSINGNTGQVIQPVQYYTTTYRGASQSVGAVTWTNWTFNSDLDNTGTNMRSADGVITFPIAGLYLVTGLLSVESPAATNYNQFRAAFAGTAPNSPILLGINELVSGNDYGYDIPISFMVKIANGGTDLMYIQAFSGSGSLTLRGGTSSSHLNVRLLG